MNWHDLLFMHWEVDPVALRRLIPPGLTMDTFAGRAFVSVVPFRMSGVRPHFVPALPGLSAFPELNVRTYVIAGGVPGIWFFSLDAASRLAVRGARRLFHLPYFDAAMSVEFGEEIRYRSRRTHRGAPDAALEMSYAPTGPVTLATPGSLDQWLTDRMSLYAADDAGRILRADVAHGPWPLQPAQASIERCSMTDWLGLPLSGPPLLHFSRRLDVVAWWRHPA